jgi:glycosyltransferase involved in cell wall biosynthesis
MKLALSALMRVALIAPPFIPVPPVEYGGTELFLAHLAKGLKALGTNVVVYTNGESTVDTEKRWLFAKSQWPLKSHYAQLDDAEHTAWALQDAARDCDIVHLNSEAGLPASRFAPMPVIYTVHHPTDTHLNELYSRLPEVDYVCISNDQSRRVTMPKRHVIHHGIDLSEYRFQETKQPYLSFIGRIAPIKGTHLAIEIAQRSGIPLKIAGEVQPMYREYFEAKVKPHLGGSNFIEYIGLADLRAKNELLGNSMAMLFPIKWNEPFGLVMVEAMACGTPVLALRGGSVDEVVSNGVSGYAARTVNQLIQYLRTFKSDPRTVRNYVESRFSLERMAKDYLALYGQVLTERRRQAA